MVKVVGIRFKPAGKIYDFDCGAFVLKQGNHVIVETDQGLSFGFVAKPPVSVEKSTLKKELKKVYRIANPDDLLQREKNAKLEKKAYDYCLECIKELELDMNLFFVESIFDASKLTFFFTAEGRVDFRQLVKMLVNKFRVKIEMRQVGIRNQAKMCGGLGRCGREICCSAFMGKFEPVSIRMAKNQGLSLNPTKISGQCGRLMCCLTFENKTYQHLKEKAPKVGKKVESERGTGKVVRHNLISNKIGVKFEDGIETEIDMSEIITGKDK